MIGIGIVIGIGIDVGSIGVPSTGWPKMTMPGLIADAPKLSRIGIVPIVIGMASGATPWQQLSIVPTIYVKRTI